MTKVKQQEIRDRLEKTLMLRFDTTLAKANKLQVYETVIAVVNDLLAEKRFNFNKDVEKKEAKRVYYMSMEFLTGASLRNNLWNLEIEKDVSKILESNSIDIEELYEIEPDAGTGNGGLGRLASCYLDSLTTLGYPATGFSIRYEYGIFKQHIVDGQQTELPDKWLDKGGMWLNRREDEAVEVRFFGSVKENWDENGLKTNHTDYVTVIATPYDLLISGYDNQAVNNLRLWGATSMTGFDIQLFSRGEYVQATEQDAIAGSISKVLYPADDNITGKSLRLKQQYFFVSASLQQITKKHYSKYKTFDNLSDRVVIHINDTHPALCIPELMRILMDEYEYIWDDAWEICRKTLAYTNHTVMSEALEKWPADLFRTLLPRIYTIVEEINRRFKDNVNSEHPEFSPEIDTMSIISNGVIHMANLCNVCCYSVNGVSKLHSDIIKEDTFRQFNALFPGKFTNVTNGIAYRRWLCQSNPLLTDLLKETIGAGYEKNLEEISDFNKFYDDKVVLDRLNEIKLANKKRLADYIAHANNIVLNPESIFDIQVKRLHEYKRQLLNALNILYIYRQIKFNGATPVPKTFIFGAKASAGYFMAKEIIRLICAISDMIEKDPVASQYLKVVFIEDYKVALAEIIMPAADISEQISQAGKEASGTGNMKLMINGAVTCGTMDGANIEIFEAAGEDNIFIFGLTTPQVNELYDRGYVPRRYYDESADIRDTLEFIKNGGVGGKDFSSIYNYLLNQDTFMNLVDFNSYKEIHYKINEAFLDRQCFAQKSLRNIANSGIFSADRSVKEYADRIWHVKRIEK